MIAARGATKERIATCCPGRSRGLDRRKSVHGGYVRNLLFRTFPLTSMRSIWVARDAESGKHGFRFGDVLNKHFD
jgi:hypothetical protein